MNSLGSLRLPPFLLSPLAHEVRGGAECFASPLNLMECGGKHVKDESETILTFYSLRLSELLSHSDD